MSRHTLTLVIKYNNYTKFGTDKNTYEINRNAILTKTVLLVDDIYTKCVNVAEDCIQTLLDLGAKDVILYVIVKTKESQCTPSLH